MGTAIATFAGYNNSYYDSYNHCGIFTGYGTENGLFGFYIWDQNWGLAADPKYIKKHFISINGSGASDADNYFIIKV